MMDWLYMGTATAIRIMMMLMHDHQFEQRESRERRPRGWSLVLGRWLKRQMTSDRRQFARTAATMRCDIRAFRVASITPRCIYQSLYFVPSSAVPCDLV